MHYANAGRIESVNEWLAHVPDDGDQRLLLARAWVSALRGREADMRAAATQARALGDLDDGPLPDGFVSVESSLRCSRRRSAGATCTRSSPTASARRSSSRPTRPGGP